MVPSFSPLAEGQLVTFEPSAKDLQNFPYATCGYEATNVFVLYETIDMASYPSWSDFKGNKSRVRPGEAGILMKCLGVPFNLQLFQKERPTLDLNVYAVLFNGQKVQVFGVDLVCKRGKILL